MKSKFHILFIVAVTAAFLLTAYSGSNSDYPGGSPAGYTGSPGDGQNCTSCHGGSASTIAGWITSDIPSSGYTAGNTYTITVTVTGSGGKGFEVSPQNTAGTLLGTLIAGASNHLVGSGKYVTQNNEINSNPATWSFQWTAPVTGTGTVTFYGAFTVSKPVTKLSTLVVNEFVPFNVNATATPNSICEGGSSQLYVVATGGSGNFTYSWTSVPAGFTSNLQNPVVTPVVTTQYIAHVNDGTVTMTDTATVAVTPLPAVNAGNDTIYCMGAPEIHLNGAAANYTSVNWMSSGTGTFSDPGSLSTIYYPTSADFNAGFVNLYITATPQLPCSGNVSDARIIQFVICSGIQDNNATAITIQPNPSTGRFVLSFSENRSKSLKIMVYDLNGRVRYSEILNSGAGTLNKTIDLTTFPKGIYILRCEIDGKLSSKKLIIQ